jgi:addiction module HigA family antidote
MLERLRKVNGDGKVRLTSSHTTDNVALVTTTTPPPHPGKILREMLEKKGWTQEELAAITGRSRRTIGAIISGVSGITPDMARALGAALGNDPADWLRWHAEYELEASDDDIEPVERRARLYQLAPIRDMQKRGWLPETDNVADWRVGALPACCSAFGRRASRPESRRTSLVFQGAPARGDAPGLGRLFARTVARC